MVITSRNCISFVPKFSADYRGRGISNKNQMETDLVEIDFGDLVGYLIPVSLGHMVSYSPFRQKLNNFEQVLLLLPPLD